MTSSLAITPRVLVAPELRWLDFGDAPADMPFARPGARRGTSVGAGAGLGATVLAWSAFEAAAALCVPVGAALGRLLGGLLSRSSGPQPVLTPWGVKLGRAYPWAEVVGVQVSSSYATVSSSQLAGDDGQERRSHLTLFLAGHRAPVSARGPYQASLDGLPQLLPRYCDAAARPLALDPEGRRVAAPHEPGALAALLRAAPDAGRLLLQGAVGYREHRDTISRDGVATLRRALAEQPWSFDRGPLAAAVAAEYDVRELADEVGHLILSPSPRVAAVAKVAAERLGLGPIVTGSLEEVAPFLPPGDLEALESWRRRNSSAQTA